MVIETGVGISNRCGIDSFGLGITCIFYRCTMCTSRHDLVSFAFYLYSHLNFYITCIYAIKNGLAKTVFCGFPRNTVFT